MTALEPHYVTVKQAAEFLALSPASVYALLDQQAIESRYKGRSRRVLVTSLREYAESWPASPEEKAS
jgi:excisionase family DNA binding protein